MANKYTKWGNKSFYSNIDKLAQDYGSYVTIPFYYGCECALKLQSFHNLIEYDGNIKTDYTEMMIVGILSTGYNMTLLQITDRNNDMELMDICFKACNTSHTLISVTCVKEWFTCSPGRVMCIREII